MEELSKLTFEQWVKVGFAVGAVLTGVSMGFWKLTKWASEKANEPLLKEMGGHGKEGGTSLRVQIENIGDALSRVDERSGRMDTRLLRVEEKIDSAVLSADRNAAAAATEMARVHARIDAANDRISTVEAIVQLRRAEKRDPEAQSA